MILPSPSESIKIRQNYHKKKKEEKLQKEAEQILIWLYNMIVLGQSFFILSRRWQKRLENKFVRVELISAGWTIKKVSIKKWEQILFSILEFGIVDKFEIIAGRE